MRLYSKVFLNQPPKQEKKEENFLNLVLYAFFSTIEIFLFYNKVMENLNAYENFIKRGKKMSIKETELFMNEIKSRWGYTFILARNIEASFNANAASRLTHQNVLKIKNL